MAARVALLLAFTGFFAVAWESDQKAEAKILLTKSRLPEKPILGQKKQLEMTTFQVGQGLIISSESDFSGCTIPEIIVPGTYRIVDAKGAVGWITIPERYLILGNTSEGSDQPEKRDFFTSQTSGGRWYFIRTEAAPVIAAPQAENSILR